jgi:hypothetical protein
LVNNQVVKVTEVWSATCDQTIADSDCVLIPLAQFPKDRTQTITMQFAIDSMTSSNNISSQFRKFEVTVEMNVNGMNDASINLLRNDIASIISTLRDLK